MKLITIIRKGYLPTIFKDAYNWSLALYLASRTSWEEALICLEQIKFPDEKVHSLKTLCLFALDRDNQALDECEKALDKISKSKMSVADKFYLENYLRGLVAMTYGESYVYPQMNFNIVSGRLLKNFPMRDHHDWKSA